MNRKDEHVSLARAFHKPTANGFDDLRFIHRSLPEITVSETTIETSLFQQKMPPIYLNAMTGGSEKTKKINQQLASAAKRTGLMMATGSVSAALKDPTLADTFTIVRETNPTGVILANIGAGKTLADAQQAVELLAADALQIHLNAPQELAMPEGDRDFRGWLAEIATITAKLSVPVIVKEVGFGMSRETVTQLMSAGVTFVDLGGSGGTDFIQIENARRPQRELTDLLGWGLSTTESLLDTAGLPITRLASGGVRQPLDVVKALALGASAVGVAATFLQELLSHGEDALVLMIQQWLQEIQLIMTMLGAKDLQQLQKAKLVISGNTKDFCDARGIPIQPWAR